MVNRNVVRPTIPQPALLIRARQPTRRSGAIAQARTPHQGAARMALLGEVFEPAVEEARHAHPMLEHGLGRRERAERAPQVLAGMTMRGFGHVRIAIHAYPR